MKKRNTNNSDLIAVRVNPYTQQKINSFAKKHKFTRTDVMRYALFKLLGDKRDKDITIEDYKRILML